jgi:hypothetical protein
MPDLTGYAVTDIAVFNAATSAEFTALLRKGWEPFAAQLLESDFGPPSTVYFMRKAYEMTVKEDKERVGFYELDNGKLHLYDPPPD